MAMAARHGPMTIGHADILTVHGCGERSSSGGDGLAVSGRGGAVRTKAMTARLWRSAAFGYPSAEVGAVPSTSTSCRMQRRTVIMNNSGGGGRRRSGSNRYEALRSRQWDVAAGEEADALADDEEEPMASFWDRLQQAWSVLIGTPSQSTKNRFSRLLVRDRGFSSANLSRLYNVAKGAIAEHVELEGDEDHEVTAVVDRLGELRLNFRVKRVKSVLMDEPFSHSVLPDLDPSLSVIGDQLWEDPEVRVGGASFPYSVLPDVDPSLSISGDQLWEDNRAPFDLKARAGIALDRDSQDSIVPDVEPSLSISGDQLWEQSRTLEDPEVHVGGALEEPVPNVVLPGVEPSLSINAVQPGDRSSTEQDLQVDEGQAFDEPAPNSVDVEPGVSISGNELWEDKGESPDLEDHSGGAFNLTSTTDVDSDGVWYTFSFTKTEVEQGIGAGLVDADLDKEP